MRVIFSRKGFDSAAGGCPSPIVGGRPISLPIPTKMPTPTRYRDLGETYWSLAEDLSNGKIRREAWCHLDPDIQATALPRLPGWRGALGQVGAAQSHLRNHHVTIGDLFLFWGLFRPASKINHWRFEGAKQHRIFGWLQIGEILELGPDGSHAAIDRPWLRDHPHVRSGWGHVNVLYIASETLILGGHKTRHAGSGVFASGYKLSAESRPSIWRIPDWLNPRLGGVGMSYNPIARWAADGTLISAARGQEFVAPADGRRDTIGWLERLFEDDP